MQRSLPLLLLLFVLFAYRGAYAQSDLPAGFYQSTFATGFEEPLGMVFDDSGRMYLWEKRGLVWIVDTAGQRRPEPLIDLREEIANWNDHGLNGFCLDRDFLNNGYFYLLYAVDPHHARYFGTPDYHPDSTISDVPTFGRVVRYRADPSREWATTLPESRTVLLGATPADGIPLLYKFHGLGTLLQGEDGTLLISTGDGTPNTSNMTGSDPEDAWIAAALESGLITLDQDVGSYRSQYLGSLNGKVLRLDPASGAGLPSNPFYVADEPRSARSRTWALGLRNPYRMSLQPHTGSHYAAAGRPGTLFIGDVGNAGWEECNIAAEGGANFGWPVYEGPKENWSFTSQPDVPNPLAPNPLFAAGECEQAYFGFREILFPLRPHSPPPPVNPCNPSLPIDAPGQRFVTPPALSWNNSQWNNPTRTAVQGFDERGHPQPRFLAEAGIEGEPFAGYSSLAGVFLRSDRWPAAYRGAYLHYDFSGWIQRFDFDSAYRVVAVAPFHRDPGRLIHLAENPVTGKLYFLKLSPYVYEIAFGGNPAPEAAFTADRYYGPGPLTVHFDARASSDQNHSAASLAYSWDFGDGQTAAGDTVSHTFFAPTDQVVSFPVRLRVSDPEGATTTAERTVSLNNTPPQAQITSFRDGDRYPMDKSQPLRLRAAVGDAEHAASELSYAWQLFTHHNEHFHPEPELTEPAPYVLISPLGCDGETYAYRIGLRVTDPAGLSTYTEQWLYPDCGKPFPDWSELRGRTLATATELDWTVSSPRPIERLEVQRAPDLFHFETLAELTPEATGSYQFRDQAPRRGNNTYRIKLWHQDRSFSYSNLATLPFPALPAVTVHPNPSRGDFRVDNRRGKAAISTVRIWDARGKIVLERHPAIAPGASWPLATALPPGPYVLELTTTDERHSVHRLIIK